MKPRVFRYGVCWACDYFGVRRLFVRPTLELSWQAAIEYALVAPLSIAEVSDEMERHGARISAVGEA